MTLLCRMIAFHFRDTLKRPLLWLGVIVVFAVTVLQFPDYLFTDFPYLTEAEYNREIEARLERSGKKNMAGELGVPVSEEEAYENAVRAYCAYVALNFPLDGEKATETILSSRLSYDDEDWSALNAYILSELPPEKREYVIPLNAETMVNFGGSYTYGTYREYRDYVDGLLKEENYTDFMGRRLADIGGTILMMYSFVVFIPLFSAEAGNDLFEVLRTKKIRPSVMIVGRYLGFSGAVIFYGLLSTAAVDALTVYHCVTLGLPFSVLDLFRYYFAWVVPSILTVGAVIGLFTMVFKTALPVIPLLLFWTLAGSRPIRKSGARSFLFS